MFNLSDIVVTIKDEFQREHRVIRERDLVDVLARLNIPPNQSMECLEDGDTV